MYKLVIFDLDGTLLNTSRDIQRVLNGSLAHFGLPTLSIEKTVEFIGDGARKLIQRALPKDKAFMLDELHAHYSKAFAECDNELTDLYDGAEELLSKLKAHDVKTAIVTNKPQRATDAVYAKLLSRFCFDCVIGQSEKYPLKPEPHSTLAVMEALHVEKEDCLFVGDGETDVKTAKNAGIDGVSALWGYRSRSQLKEAGAINFAQSYAQLEELIFGKNL